MTDIFGVYNIRSRISVGLVVLAPLWSSVSKYES